MVTGNSAAALRFDPAPPDRPMLILHLATAALVVTALAEVTRMVIED